MSFMPMRACANIAPSRTTIAPASAATRPEAKSRRASRTMKNSIIAARSTPGRRHASACGPDGTAVRLPTGRPALAWRLPGVLLAAMMAFFIVLLARRLFASGLVAALAGAIVVLDGAMFAQARIGMNDIYIGTFLVAGWYFVVAAHAPRRSAAVDVLIAGILFGLAAASKWAAFYALAGLGLYSVIVTAYAWSRERPGTGGPFDLLAWRGRVPNA